MSCVRLFASFVVISSSGCLFKSDGVDIIAFSGVHIRTVKRREEPTQPPGIRENSSSLQEGNILLLGH